MFYSTTHVKGVIVYLTVMNPTCKGKGKLWFTFVYDVYEDYQMSACGGATFTCFFCH